MKALISADQLVAEGQTMHEATLLQPEDAAEAAKHNIQAGQQLVCHSTLYTSAMKRQHTQHIGKALVQSKPVGIPAGKEDALNSCKGYKPLSEAVRATAQTHLSASNSCSNISCSANGQLAQGSTESVNPTTSESTSLPTQLSL